MRKVALTRSFDSQTTKSKIFSENRFPLFGMMLVPSIGSGEHAFGDAVQPDALDHLTSTGRVGKMWSPRDCIDLEHVTMGAVPRRRIRRQIFRSQEGVLAEQAAWSTSR